MIVTDRQRTLTQTLSFFHFTWRSFLKSYRYVICVKLNFNVTPSAVPLPLADPQTRAQFPPGAQERSPYSWPPSPARPPASPAADRPRGARARWPARSVRGGCAVV